jgi:hypothetical protein
MKIVSTEIFVLADPPPGPDEAAYQLPSPGGWSPRIRELACLRIPISPLIEYAPADIYPSPLRRELQRLGILW